MRVDRDILSPKAKPSNNDARIILGLEIANSSIPLQKINKYNIRVVEWLMIFM